MRHTAASSRDNVVTAPPSSRVPVVEAEESQCGVRTDEQGAASVHPRVL